MIKDGGLCSDTKSIEEVIYFNKNQKKEDSIIRLYDSIGLKQKAKRYLKCSGTVNIAGNKFFNGQYQSVIFEVSYTKHDAKHRDFYTFPIINNKFSGYIYFKNQGINKVYAYFFMIIFQIMD
jgi:hypothetical protein